MTTFRSATPAAMVSSGTRLAAILAVAATVSAAWLAAGHESRVAVQASAAAMGPKATYVTLPTVEIIGKREPAAKTAVAASVSLARNSL